VKRGINSKPLNLGFLVFPLRNPDDKAGQTYLTQFIGILSALSKELLVIIGNYYPNSIPENVKIANVSATIVRGYKESLISKARRVLRAQLTLSLKLIQLGKKIDIVVLPCWGPVFLPTLVTKIQRKKIVVAVAGSTSQGTWVTFRPPLKWLIPPALGLIEQFNYALADKIIVTSESIFREFGISKYNKDKVIVAYVLTSYLDTERFRIKRSLAERGNIVGFVGQLRALKGVLELARAIPLILSQRNDARFLIVGDGPLMDEMKQELKRAGCLDRVDFEGWVPYDAIPDYMNKMRFLLLPSFKEMLGVVTIQAMACGAILIANPGGGIKDFIVDGKVGFLLKDNSPQSIADKVIEVWDHPELERIQKDARTLVEQTFSYEKVLEGWRHIFNSLQE